MMTENLDSAKFAERDVESNILAYNEQYAMAECYTACLLDPAGLVLTPPQLFDGFFVRNQQLLQVFLQNGMIRIAFYSVGGPCTMDLAQYLLKFVLPEGKPYVFSSMPEYMKAVREDDGMRHWKTDILHSIENFCNDRAMASLPKMKGFPSSKAGEELRRFYELLQTVFATERERHDIYVRSKVERYPAYADYMNYLFPRTDPPKLGDTAELEIIFGLRPALCDKFLEMKNRSEAQSFLERNCDHECLADALEALNLIYNAHALSPFCGKKEAACGRKKISRPRFHNADAGELIERKLQKQFYGIGGFRVEGDEKREIDTIAGCPVSCSVFSVNDVVRLAGELKQACGENDTESNRLAALAKHGHMPEIAATEEGEIVTNVRVRESGFATYRRNLGLQLKDIAESVHAEQVLYRE